jgi:hypothetical protein
MKLSVADLIVEINPIYDLLKSRLGPYIYDGEREADIVIPITERFFIDRHNEHPELTLEECEYLYTSSCFYTELIKFGGIMLHSSCVQYENYAYLFSANSGVGKSTHTHLWLEKFPTAEILNDDKPAIRKIGDKYYAFGTPWSGKTDENVNEGVPIGGICFLSRGENKIKRIPGIMALKLFMEQTVRPADKVLMNKMLETLNIILTNVPIYQMTCDMSEDAVMTAVNGMVKGD